MRKEWKGWKKFSEGWWQEAATTGPYQFLMSVFPRREVHKMPHNPSTWAAQSACAAGLIPTGAAMGDAQVPERWLTPFQHACFLRNMTLPMYCLSLVFISWYLICDSESTKTFFLLRCPPHVISSWEKKSHFALLRKHLTCLIVPSTGKKCNHWVIRQFGRRGWQTLNEISAVNQIFFAAILIWTGVKRLQQWGTWGRELCL